MYRILYRFLVPGWSAKPLVSTHRHSSRTSLTSSALYSDGYDARVRPPIVDSPLDPPRIPGSGCQPNRVSSNDCDMTVVGVTQPRANNFKHALVVVRRSADSVIEQRLSALAGASAWLGHFKREVL